MCGQFFVWADVCVGCLLCGQLLLWDVCCVGSCLCGKFCCVGSVLCGKFVVWEVFCVGRFVWDFLLWENCFVVGEVLCHYD